MKISEAIFVGIAWMPKGMVTVAVGFSFYPIVWEKMDSGPEKDKQMEYALLMMATCVIPLVISTPIALIITNTYMFNTCCKRKSS